MSRRTRRIILIVVVGIIVALGIRFGNELHAGWDRFWEIDACLDHGGSWDYEAERCDRE